jgi:pyruvate dehydrogenase E2 component (dihydrolipoamide acetyltransferase)
LDVVLPKNSLTMTEAEIVEWHVEEGGAVTAGDPLFTMETEKSQVVVEASVSGTLERILAAPGEVVSAGDTIATVATGDGAGSPERIAAHTPRSVAPAAAELAAQLGLNIEEIRGSGSGGRVIEEDVLKALGAGPQRQSAQTESASPQVALNMPTRSAVVQSKKRATGNKTTEIAASIPTFQVGSLLRFPSSPRPDRATFSDLLVAATAQAVREVPLANALIEDDEVRTYDDVRVGLLVRDNDALVPLVFADPDRLDLGELHSRRRDLMKRVKSGTLPQGATAWPTIVISNIGRPSIRWFTAVLYPGTSATLAVGGIGAVKPDCVEIVLTCDHRVLDGVDGATFLEALAASLESLHRRDEVTQ